MRCELKGRSQKQKNKVQVIVWKKSKAPCARESTAGSLLTTCGVCTPKPTWVHPPLLTSPRFVIPMPELSLLEQLLHLLTPIFFIFCRQLLVTLPHPCPVEHATFFILSLCRMAESFHFLSYQMQSLQASQECHKLLCGHQQLLEPGNQCTEPLSCSFTVTSSDIRFHPLHVSD